MKNLILKYVPLFDQVLESQFVDQDGKIVGYHHSLVDKRGKCLSSGCHHNQNFSKMICISESLERAIISELSANEIKKGEFYLDRYPTSSGFAAGFDQSSTRFRSICEGLERWIWSQWIDYHHKLIKVSQLNLSELGACLIKDFDEFLVFEKSFYVDILDFPKQIFITVFIGIKDDGIYPGSRVSTLEDDRLTHSIIESWRHLKMIQKSEKYNFNEDIIMKRIHFFSQNKEKALDQINQSKKEEWPLPDLMMLKNFEDIDSKIYVWRCLFKEFIPWNVGSYDRFVY